MTLGTGFTLTECVPSLVYQTGGGRGGSCKRSAASSSVPQTRSVSEGTGDQNRRTRASERKGAYRLGRGGGPERMLGRGSGRMLGNGSGRMHGWGGYILENSLVAEDLAKLWQVAFDPPLL